MAALLNGLPRESRIKRNSSNEKYTLQENLLMFIADELRIISWQFATLGGKSVEHPQSIYKLCHPENQEESKDVPEQYEEASDFDREWERLTRK